MKPENVLLVEEGVGDDGKVMLKAKVGDLGSVKKEIDGGWGGTPSYLTPETVNDRKQERASDIWAAGLIVLEMLNGEHPLRVIYDIEPDCFCVVEGMWPAVPFTLSWLTRDFICRCLEDSPERRFTAEELLSREFVADVML